MKGLIIVSVLVIAVAMMTTAVPNSGIYILHECKVKELPSNIYLSSSHYMPQCNNNYYAIIIWFNIP